MSFSEETLIKKLQDLTNTQQSVQTLSLWLIHHRKHAKTIVTIWLKELLNELKQEKKLTYIYLANDILQNSRKKGPEYQNEFTTNILLEAIQNTSLNADSKLRFTLERILNIWKDRKIFSDSKIEQFKNALHKPDTLTLDNLDDNILRSPPTVGNLSTPKKYSKKSPLSDDESDDLTSRKKRKSIVEPVITTPTTKHTPFLSSTIFNEIDIGAAVGDLKAPDSLELVKMLQDLENSASSDAIVRGKIAELPTQICDLNSINKLKDQNETIDFSRRVNDSLVLLDEYNKRLSDELIIRKKTAALVSLFIKEQQKLAENDKQMLNDWKLKLKQVDNVKNELKIHLKSLPDLKIIDEAAELSPLPTANDLFST